VKNEEIFIPSEKSTSRILALNRKTLVKRSNFLNSKSLASKLEGIQPQNSLIIQDLQLFICQVTSQLLVFNFNSEEGDIVYDLKLPNDSEYQINPIQQISEKNHSLNLVRFKKSVFFKHQQQIFILDLRTGEIRPQKEIRNSTHLAWFVIFDSEAKIQDNYRKYQHKDKSILQNPKLFALYQTNTNSLLVEHNINSDGREIRKASQGNILLEPSLDHGRFITLAVSGLYFAACEWNNQLDVSLRIIHRATQDSYDTFIHQGSLL